MKEINFKVEGMMCEGCENRVRNAIKNIEGGEEVLANHNEKIVKVIFVENIDENNIKEVIEELGFEVIE